jgi:hypothetical protein
MLYREIIAVFSQIHTKHISTLCGQNVELLSVKLVIYIYIYIYSDHWGFTWLMFATHIVQRQNTSRSANNELKRVWQEATLASFNAITSFACAY